MRSLARRVLRRVRRIASELRHGPRRILARRLAAAGLVDRAWYERQTGRRFRNAPAAARHYLSSGRRAGLSPHVLVEPEWIAGGAWRNRVDPLRLYLAGRSLRGGPSPAFDDAVYAVGHADAAGGRGQALRHFVRTCGPDSVLPTPRAVPRTTMAELRERVESVEEVVRAHAMLRGVRPTADWDAAADAAYVARWSHQPIEWPAGSAEGAPLVSVVIPVRNRPEQIRAAVESVRAQTFSGWELLVVDDGSTDTTPSVVEELQAADPRVRLIRQPQSGASAARNAGVDAARGHYVAFLDSDNVWVPHFLQVAMASMTAQHLRSAYAVVEMRDQERVRYLAYEGGLAHLEFANHIDLNVFIAEAELVRSVGAFDRGLKRMIDWDLVVKIAKTYVPVLLPFVGVHYVDHGELADRISVREPTSWGEVMLARNLVDWAALDASVDERDPALTSLVVSVRDDWSAAMSLIDRALRHAPAGSVEVVVVDRASRPAIARLVAARYGGDPRVAYLRQPRDGRVALAWTEGLARTHGAVVVMVDARCQLRDSGAPLDEPWWQPLRDALDDPSAGAVAPLVIGPTGTVAAAGLGTRGPEAAPYPLYVDAAPEDVVRGGPLRVGALGDDVLAARAADLVAARGPDPWYVNGLWGADLSARIAGGERALLVLPQVRLVRAAEPETDVSEREVAGLHDRVGALLPVASAWGEDEAWARAGLELASVQGDAGGLGRPVTRRRRLPAPTGPSAGRPALRWAVKIGAPSHEQGDKWGDVHFASDLAAALERLGQLVVVDRLPAHQRSTAGLDDVVLNIRGLSTPELAPGPVHVLWVISHPDDVTPDEIRAYDLAFAASRPWAERITAQAGVAVVPLLQATDPSRFHPDLAEPDSGPAALFVGNSRGVERPVVRDAIAAGVDVDVYGTRWKDFVDPKFVRGDYLPNETVGAAYRAAGVVLNDHWPDMAAQGFVSNRVFDAVAAGGRVISDPVEGLEEIFGGAARAYRTPADLARWTGAGRAEAFPPEARLLEISARIRREHSFDARAEQLLAAVVAFTESRPTAPTA